METRVECWPLLTHMCTSMCNVVHRRVVLGAVVGPIVGAFVPVVPELVFRFPALEPVQSYVHHLDLFCNDSDIAGD